MIESYKPQRRNYHYIRVTFAHAAYFGHVVIRVGGNRKGASILSEGLEFWENCDAEDVSSLNFNDCELELYNGNYDEFWFRMTLTNPSTGEKMQFDELDDEELTNMIVSVEFDKVEPSKTGYKYQEVISMKKFVGTKVIEAEPMTRGAYAERSGRNSILTEKGESANDAGYLVRYEDGYESWSPASAFEKAYRDFANLSFGHAIELMKRGYKLARAGWNGKKQYIQLATCISFKTPDGTIINSEHNAIGNQAIAFVGTSGIQMGWLASQADMLAEDWCVFDLI